LQPHLTRFNDLISPSLLILPFQGKTLQTGFLIGMEQILGVPRMSEEGFNSRYNAREADSLEEEERRDSARQRYQQLYWESVPEDGRVNSLRWRSCHKTNVGLGTTSSCISRKSQSRCEAIYQGRRGAEVASETYATSQRYRNNQDTKIEGSGFGGARTTDDQIC
jgi:hypothetical protein